MRVLVLDAMGVIYQAGDDVAELLISFVCSRSEVTPMEIQSLYHQCSLGEFRATVFWQRLDLPADIEDKYLNDHKLVRGVEAFLAEARNHFDSIWCLSNDINEWSIKLREMFDLEKLFDGFVISGDVKARKPSLEIYKALCVAANCRPEDVLFIDDRPKNVIAALDYGMRAILFGNQSEPVPGLLHVQDYLELKRMVCNSGQENGEIERE